MPPKRVRHTLLHSADRPEKLEHIELNPGLEISSFPPALAAWSPYTGSLGPTTEWTVDTMFVDGLNAPRPDDTRSWFAESETLDIA